MLLYYLILPIYLSLLCIPCALKYPLLSCLQGLNLFHLCILLPTSQQVKSEAEAEKTIALENVRKDLSKTHRSEMEGHERAVEQQISKLECRLKVALKSEERKSENERDLANEIAKVSSRLAVRRYIRLLYECVCSALDYYVIY